MTATVTRALILVVAALVSSLDIAVIRRQLGHASLLTTVRYLDHLEPESVVTRIAMRQPTP